MKERIWIRCAPRIASAITTRVDEAAGLPDKTGTMTACRVYPMPESADVILVLDAKHRSKLTATQRAAEVRADNALSLIRPKEVML